jgi:vitamin-K-epoxide reductase (warfarin-sensitive)
MVVIMVLAVLGMIISLYTNVLEQKIKKTPSYKPVCDLSDTISCTKPMKSKYASIFYISNAWLAFAFYVLVFVFAALHQQTFLLITVIVGCLMSCYFAYLLYFKIKALCLLCTSMYVINVLLLVACMKINGII